MSDVETASSSLILQVESLSSGQSLKIGTSSNEAGATVYGSSNKQVTSTKSIYWMPATNTTGIVDAVKFSVIDAGGVSSSTQGLLRMNIDTGSNAAPSITGTNYSLGSTYGVGQAFTVSYATLQSGLSATDSDGSYVTFVLTSISNGTIKKGSTTMTAMTGASQANPVSPLSTTQLSPGESLVFLPTSSTTGSAVTLATVRGWDGTTYSATEVTLQATFVATTNQVPVLTYVKDFTGAVKNTAYAFSYDSLRGDPSLMSQGTQRTDAYDAEENIASKSLKFRVKSITASSVLARTTPTSATLAVNDTIDPGQSLTWTPPTGYTGRQAAFTLVAYDGTSESSTAIQVYVYVNKDPTFTNSTNLITGVTESSPYVITYDKLFNTFPSSDDSTGILGYQISSLTGATGTLQRYVSGVLTNVTAPYTMYPGDQVIWTPPLYENSNTIASHQIFKLKLIDNESATSSEIDVKGVVTSTNDAPVILSASSLTSVAKNVVKTITYTDIFNAIDFRDYDLSTSAKPTIGNTTLSFRIESVNAGTLVGSNGTAIAPTPTNSSTMKYLVYSGADLSSSWTSVNWTPPSNLTGTFTVMKVRVFDGMDWSETAASISITVTSANSTPTATVGSFTYSPGISEDGGLLVTYDDLVGYTGASDADGDVVKFKVSYLRTGTAIISGTTYSVAGAIAGEPVIGPGQTFIWKPAANATGTPQAFDIKLTDTANDSAAMTASVTVSSVNDAPTIAYETPTITGATRYATGNNPFVISYSMLGTALGAADTEGDTITYTIVDWLGGQGIGSSASSTCASSVTYYPSAVSTNSASTYLCWIPPAGTTGDVTAFRVQVSDSNGAIGGKIATVKVNVTGNSIVPSFLSGCFAASQTTANTFTCLTQNIFGTTVSAFPINKATAQSFSFSYDYLATLAGVYDTDSSPVSFVITGLSSTIINANATLRKSGVNVTTYASGTPATTALLGPGETLTYATTSSLTTTGSNLLFTFKAWDGAQVSSSAINVNANILNVASGNLGAPAFVYSAPIPLSSIATSAWTEIPYSTIRQYVDAYDPDENNNRTLMIFRLGFFADTTRFTVQKKNGANACSSGLNTAITNNSTTLANTESLCVQVLSPGNTALSASATTSVPIITIKTQDYNNSNVDSGNFIPLMVKQP
ncbi:hypothetical protein EBU99_13500 [bacterium]|nr:hypothetical protein [bacterium]